MDKTKGVSKTPTKVSIKVRHGVPSKLMAVRPGRLKAMAKSRRSGRRATAEKKTEASFRVQTVHVLARSRLLP